jgi:hypothetical protein
VPYELSLSILPYTWTGCPLTCVFATVSEAWKYLATVLAPCHGDEALCFINHTKKACGKWRCGSMHSSVRDWTGE